MLNTVSYNKVRYKFHNGVNRIDDYNIIDYSLTSFGGFTDGFNQGTGRRIELPTNEVELTVNTHASFNHKHFYFARCYTAYRIDTTDLDKKQDIVKYTAQLTKDIDSSKTILPIIAYYNNESEFVVDDINFNSLDIVSDRSYGYSNCLIVKNKFEASQKFYTIMSFINWQKHNTNNNSIELKNYNLAVEYLNNCLRQIGYDKIYYDFVNKKLYVSSYKDIDIETLNVEIQIYIGIMFDILMKAIMLNPKNNNPFNVEGCIGITYPFNIFYKNKLIDNITKIFPNVQLLVLNEKYNGE